jgi:hypothetical protein
VLSKKWLLWLFAAGLIISFAAAWLESVPGYMDAEYYYGGALRLAQGKGWTENVIWNFLDQPQGLPHPAHLYWMPLASFLAVPGLWFFRTSSFLAARLLMILLAGAIAPLTAFISMTFLKNKKFAILSGFLALFPGFYLIYTTDTETYTPYLLLGGLVLLIGFKNGPRITWVDALVLGGITGCMHLARADGILWFGGTAIILLWFAFDKWKAGEAAGRWVISRCGLLGLGYLTVMSPWYLRNFIQLGSFFVAGTSRALWLTQYNQLFIYPPEQLNIQNWMASGWQAILQVRASALGDNLKTLVGVQGEVLLIPFILVGAYALRAHRFVVFGLLLWLITFIVMSLVFPLAGARGGFFHSGSATQILFWILAPPGLEKVIKFASRTGKRKWNRDEAWRVFATGMVLITAGLTGAIYTQNVIGADNTHPVWNSGNERAKDIEQELTRLAVGEAEPILINNPPGYFATNGRAAIVIPDGSVQSTLDVARRYQVKYMVLEKAHVDAMNVLYQSPQSDPHFKFLGQVNDARLFRIEP